MDSFLASKLLLIECNIDDMNPEHYPFVMERLFEAGARDVWLSPITMKGGRPGNCLSVLCDREHQSQLSALVFAETSSIGLRIQEILRAELERVSEEVDTRYGSISIKVAKDLNGKILNAAPEFSDCKKAALKAKVALKEVYSEAIASYFAKKRT